MILKDLLKAILLKRKMDIFNKNNEVPFYISILQNEFMLKKKITRLF